MVISLVIFELYRINSMKKILWLSPNINHYKARVLNHLANVQKIELTVLSGTGREGMGDQEIEYQWDFNHIRLDVSKQNFGKSALVRKSLKDCFDSYDWVLIPSEKKNFTLILFGLWLKSKHKRTKLFSYNHPILKSKNGRTTFADKFMTKFYYKVFDRIIFYTEDSAVWAIKNKLIEPKKAYWANNTIDTSEVRKYYTFELPPINEITIVFIGRLIPSKRVHVLIDFFNQFVKKSSINSTLEIIGNGPDSYLVEKAMKDNSKIIWHGTLVDEINISAIMKRASLVFVPGSSGLSINHAFVYGRPYATLRFNRHGPEISYLKHGENGFIIDDDLSIIKSFLNNRKKVEAFCYNAFNSAKNLSVLEWTKQIKTALNA